MKQDRRGYLIIQVTTFDKASFCHDGTRIKGDKISDFNTQGPRLVRIGHFFVQTNFHVGLIALSGTGIPIDMDRGLVHENGTCKGLTILGTMN